MSAAAVAGPSFLTSVRDAALVARFELLRAVRTWQALAVVVLYLVATAGSMRIFVAMIGAFETALAEQLGVPATDYPGAMLDRLIESAEFREVLAAMVGADRLVEHVLQYPILAVFHLWLGILLVPFLATFNSAESVSVDLRTRAVRFEVLRTGRLELVVGRFAGQALLAAVASLAAVGATWVVGMTFMVGNDPVDLAVATTWLSIRAWAFGLPFIGIGVGASQLTASPAWARVIAVCASGATWVGYGIARWGEGGRLAVVADVALQVLPQGWILPLWEPGFGWVGACAVFLALGLACTGLGYLRFARRDL